VRVLLNKSRNRVRSVGLQIEELVCCPVSLTSKKLLATASEAEGLNIDYCFDPYLIDDKTQFT
jgi:hypothetical protein